MGNKGNPSGMSPPGNTFPQGSWGPGGTTGPWGQAPSPNSVWDPTLGARGGWAGVPMHTNANGTMVQGAPPPNLGVNIPTPGGANPWSTQQIGLPQSPGGPLTGIGSQFNGQMTQPNAGPQPGMNIQQILTSIMQQKGGGGLSPIGTRSPMPGPQQAPQAPAPASPFSATGTTIQGQPFGYNPADPSLLEGTTRGPLADQLAMNQPILDHMAAYRAKQTAPEQHFWRNGATGMPPGAQPFDQGGLTPPVTPAVTPPPPAVGQGWPTNLLALLRNMGQG